MIIFEHILFRIKICSLLKSSTENLCQKTIFLERAFVEKIFCLDKFKKKKRWKTPEKNQTEKEKREKHNKRKKEKDNWKIEKSFCSQKKKDGAKIQSR